MSSKAWIIEIAAPTLGMLQTRPSFNSYNILSVQLEAITILL